MRKFIFTIILSIMTTAAVNICHADGACFNDVTQNTPYYEDIQRLRDMNVLSGYDNGSFCPDNSVTVAEGITIAEKAFGGEGTLPKRWCDWFDEKCGWRDNIHIDRYLFLGDFSKNMSCETAAEMVMKLNSLKPIDAALWGMRSTSYNRYINTLYIRGYTSETGKEPYSMGTLTRGEFCHMVVYMLDYDGTYTIQPVEQMSIQPTVYKPEQLTDSNAYTLEVKSLMLCIPENIRDAFIADGYEVIIVPYHEWFNLFPDGGKYTGYYIHTAKHIYIRSDYGNSIVHEFGHYLHSKLQNNGYDISTDDSFKRRLGLFRYNNYYMKNDNEFFAEAFDLHCTIPDRLKKEAPEVYEFIDNAIIAFEKTK